MILLAISIFGFCVWAIFSHRFIDGIVAKGFLIFAAISASTAYLDPQNTRSIMLAGLFLCAALVYWYFRKDEIRRTYERNLFHRRHTDPRSKV